MEEKQCSKCKKWKELDEFNKDKSRNDGLQRKCKQCQKEYRINNKEKLVEYFKVYRYNNKELIKKQKKEYCQTNKINEKKRRKDWYQTNKEYVKNKSQEHYKTNKEWYKEHNKNHRYNNKELIKKQKKEYNISYIMWNSDFTSKIETYEEIRQNGDYLEVKCTYCGRWFIPFNININNRLQSINGTASGENRLYCSTNCKKECPIYRQVKYPKGYKKATSREVQPELRQMVLERDNYICKKCGLTQDELKVGLHCHHKEGILWEPLQSADMDMCLTFCKTCHEKVHQIEGCKYSDMKCGKKIR